MLEEELGFTYETADDDRLRLHEALASNYYQLGEYHPALQHGTEELRYRLRLQNSDHPAVLAARSNVASWTGECGDAWKAVQLFERLLPDYVRVLGPYHPAVLAIRNNIARWTGECGDAAGDLQKSRELLPDRTRALGPSHPSTLATRGNIAHWTGECGDAAAALKLLGAALLR